MQETPQSPVQGLLTLNPEVIGTIASREAASVDGIVGLEDTFIADIKAMLRGGHYPKGVRVEIGDGEVFIALRLSFRYGVRIPATIVELRRRIKDAVLQMTGYQVRAIDVTLNRLFLQDEKAPQALDEVRASAGVSDMDVEFQ